ncbi:MAG: hypothetical protein WBC84_20280 [Pseudolabrys sp.]
MRDRFGSSADIFGALRDVRFTFASGRPVLRDPGSRPEIQKHRQQQELLMGQILNSTSDPHVTSQKQKLEKRGTLAFFPYCCPAVLVANSQKC